MAARSEQTALLGSSNRRSPGDPPTSLQDLATERLGSLKWLMAKSEEAPSRTGFFTNLMKNRAFVRRSASEDIDRERKPALTPGAASGVTASVTPGRRRGDRERNGSGFSWVPGGRQRFQRGSTRRETAKNYYHLSIDLETPPTENSVWVRSRKSCVLEAPMPGAVRRQEENEAEDSNETQEETEPLAEDVPGRKGGGIADLAFGFRDGFPGGTAGSIACGALVATVVVATWLCLEWMAAAIVTGILAAILLVGVIVGLGMGHAGEATSSVSSGDVCDTAAGETKRDAAARGGVEESLESGVAAGVEPSEREALEARSGDLLGGLGGTDSDLPPASPVRPVTDEHKM